MNRTPKGLPSRQFAMMATSIAIIALLVVTTILMTDDVNPGHAHANKWGMATCARHNIRRRGSDGSDHDTMHWAGAADTDFLFLAPKSSPASIERRPNERELSNELGAQPDGGPKHPVYTSLVWSFGQALDHAITLVAPSDDPEDEIHIDVTGDATFDPHSSGAYIRSGGVLPHNMITHFVDGNMMYGSSARNVIRLRGWRHGRMETDGEYPPREGSGRAVGDVRGNEQPVLLALHTLFLREHNFQAGRLAKQNRHWNDECLYHAARSIVEAEFRHIVFDEFVPALLGEPLPHAAANYSCSPEISAEFSGAAYRLHTLVSEHLAAYNTTTGALLERVRLCDTFFNNAFLDAHGVGALLLGQIKERSEAFDLKLVDSLRQRLFPDEGVHLDLLALNIARGRKLRLASFSTLRATLLPGLGHLAGWHALGADAFTTTRLEQLYNNRIGDLDAFVGMHAEAAGAHQPLPPTIKAVLRDQFLRLRNCDPLHFAFLKRPADRAYVYEHGSLRDILLRNTDISEELLPPSGHSLFLV